MEPIAPLGAGTSPLPPLPTLPPGVAGPLGQPLQAPPPGLQGPPRTGTARVAGAAMRGGRAVVVVDGTPTWEALNAAVAAAAEETAAEASRAAGAAPLSTGIERPEDPLVLARRQFRIAFLQKTLRQLKVRREKLVIKMDKNAIALKRLGLTISDLKAALRVAYLDKASPVVIRNLLGSIDRAESLLQKFEGQQVADEAELAAIDGQLGAIEGELSRLMFG